MVAIGSVSAVDAKPGEVIRSSWSLSPSGYVLVHNHPSGDPKPSRTDKAFTNRFSTALTLHGAKLYDHIIIGDGKYFSFSQEGMLD